MSDIEIFWKAIAAKFDNHRDWGDLNLNEQLLIVQAVNMILQVVNNR